MKKIVMLLAAFAVSAMLFAQDRQMTELKVSQLPKKVTETIAKDMPGSVITRAGQVVENGVTSYVAVVKNKGVKHSFRYDKDGKFLGKADRLRESAKASTINQSQPNPNADPKEGTPAAKPPVKVKTLQPAPKAKGVDVAVPKK